jgi:hypothetical protein
MREPHRKLIPIYIQRNKMQESENNLPIVLLIEHNCVFLLYTIKKEQQ